MSTHELVVDVAGDVVEVEQPLLRGDLRVKHDLDQHVAQFLPHVRVIPTVDRVDQFAHLVDEAPHEARVGLFLVPGTPIRGPQPGHRPPQFIDRAHARRKRHAAKGNSRKNRPTPVWFSRPRRVS